MGIISSVLFGALPKLIRPITDLIDDLHTSDEEKLRIKQEMFNVEQELAQQILTYETKLMEAKASIITAEASSSSWIASNWRPITMLSFLGLVILDSFNVLPNALASEAWTLLQIGLGGYVVGRSAEKVTKVLKSNGG